MSDAVSFTFQLIDQASAAASSIGGALKGLTGKLNETSEASGKQRDAMGRFIAGSGQAGDSVFGMSIKMGFASDAIRRINDIAIGAAKALAGFVISTASLVLDAVDFRENSEIAFGALLKSKGYAESASEIFDNALKFASASPFKADMIVGEYQKLLAAGFKPIDIPIAMKGGSDLASAMNKGAAGVEAFNHAMIKMNSLGVLGGESLQMLADAGLSRTDLTGTLAKTLGKSNAEITKMLAAGKIDAATGSRAIIETIRDNISGGELGSISEKKSHTVSGLMSTLQSASLMLFKDVDTSAFKGALETVAGLLDKGTAGGKQLKSSVESLFGGGFAKVGEILSPANIGKAFEFVVGAIKMVGQAINFVWPLIKEIGAGFLEGIQPALIPLKELWSALMDINGSGTDTGASMRSFGQVLGFLVGVVVDLVGATVFGFGVMAQAIGDVGGAIMWLIDAGANLVRDFLIIGDALASAGGQIIDGLWGGIKAGWASLLSNFSALVDLLPATVKSALGIHSPSRVFAELGLNVAAGFSGGVDAGADDAQQSMVAMVDPSLARAARGGGAASSGGTSGGNVINITNMIDGAKDPHATAEAVGETVTRILANLFETTAIESGATGAFTLWVRPFGAAPAHGAFSRPRMTFGQRSFSAGNAYRAP